MRFEALIVLTAELTVTGDFVELFTVKVAAEELDEPPTTVEKLLPEEFFMLSDLPLAFLTVSVFLLTVNTTSEPLTDALEIEPPREIISPLA